MNVMLVSPYRGALFESSGIIMQPLGISYVGAALKHAGHDVQIEILEDPETLPDFSNADVVGISCSTVQYKPGLKVAKSAKEAGKITIMGGVHPTSSPTDVLSSGYVDYVVRGEGEITSVNLLECLEHKKKFYPEKIEGISWISNGIIRHNKPRRFTDDLDIFPFPVREANWRSRGRIKACNDIDYPVITTRGCPYSCRFCEVKVVAGRKFRIRSVENIIQEVEYIVNKYGKRKLLFTDDIINFDPQRLSKICDALIERGLPVMSWVMGRADHLIQFPESVEKMAGAGVESMFLGIESPQNRVLKTYKKGGKCSAEISERAVHLLREYGIETWGAFMMGEPSETEDDIMETLDYAKYLNPGVAQFSILTPYPGTEIWKEYQSRIFTKDWDKYDCMHSVFRGDNLESRELESLCRKAYVSFYLQPKRIAREIFSKHHYGRPNLKMVKQLVRSVKTILNDKSKENSEDSDLKQLVN